MKINIFAIFEYEAKRLKSTQAFSIGYRKNYPKIAHDIEIFVKDIINEPTENQTNKSQIDNITETFMIYFNSIPNNDIYIDNIEKFNSKHEFSFKISFKRIK